MKIAPGNRVCGLLGIRYPVLQGGMLWIADAALASSVSNSGGLGTISPYAGMPENGDSVGNLKTQISQTRRLTDKPFAVNIPLDLPESGLLINVLLEEQVRIAVLAAGSPHLYTELLRSSGVRVLHVISSVSQAQFAQFCGVDAVIAAGAEAGGRIGREPSPLSALIPTIAAAVSIPVIAAGGIVGGAGIRSALAFGAGGVQLGTRFIAATECIAHSNYKQAIVAAGPTDTIVAGRRLGQARRLKSKFSMELLALENSEAPIESVRNFAGRGRARRAQLEGDLREGDFLAGASAGLIQSILPASTIMENLISGQVLASDLLAAM